MQWLPPRRLGVGAFCARGVALCRPSQSGREKGKRLNPISLGHCNAGTRRSFIGVRANTQQTGGQWHECLALRERERERERGSSLLGRRSQWSRRGNCCQASLSAFPQKSSPRMATLARLLCSPNGSRSARLAQPWSGVSAGMVITLLFCFSKRQSLAGQREAGAPSRLKIRGRAALDRLVVVVFVFVFVGQYCFC